MCDVRETKPRLHFAPSPLLEYKYPKANEAIARNIANGGCPARNIYCTRTCIAATYDCGDFDLSRRGTIALIALPKFYTQVLHLMNKMNLPPPFEENAIPGKFSKDREQRAAALHQMKRRFPGAKPDAFTVEEEEEEEVDTQETAAKKQRMEKQDSVETPSKTPPAGDRHLPKSSVAGVHANKSKRPPASTSENAKAFATNASGLDKLERSVRPGVISEAELNRQRLSSAGTDCWLFGATALKGESNTNAWRATL